MAGERTLTSIEDSAGGPGSGGQLLVVGGGQVFTFALPASGEVTIGRAPECQVIIDHRKLSRRHAVLRVGPPPTVQDLGSTNGTRVSRELLVPEDEPGDGLQPRDGPADERGERVMIAPACPLDEVPLVHGRPR